MKRIAVFPGSFDPFTKGHESIVKRAMPLFDKIIIAVSSNPEKKYMFSLDQRMNWIKKVFFTEKKVMVKSSSGLTVKFCQKEKSGYILRGLRTSSDFEYERAIGQMNRVMDSSIETIYLLTTPELTAVHSTIVRDIIRHGGDAGAFVPQEVDFLLKKKK